MYNVTFFEHSAGQSGEVEEAECRCEPGEAAASCSQAAAPSSLASHLRQPPAQLRLWWSGKIDLAAPKLLCSPIATRFWGSWLPGKHDWVLLWKPGFTDHRVPPPPDEEMGTLHVCATRRQEIAWRALVLSIKLQNGVNRFYFHLFNPSLLLIWRGKKTKLRIIHLGNRLEEQVRVGGGICLLICVRKVSKTFCAQITWRKWTWKPHKMYNFTLH